MAWVKTEANLHHDGAGVGPFEMLDEVPRANASWEIFANTGIGGRKITTSNCPTKSEEHVHSRSSSEPTHSCHLCEGLSTVCAKVQALAATMAVCILRCRPERKVCLHPGPDGNGGTHFEIPQLAFIPFPSGHWRKRNRCKFSAPSCDAQLLCPAAWRLCSCAVLAGPCTGDVSSLVHAMIPRGHCSSKGCEAV